MTSYQFEVYKSKGKGKFSNKEFKTNKFERYFVEFIGEGIVNMKTYNTAKDLARKVVEEGKVDVPFSVEISSIEKYNL